MGLLWSRKCGTKCGFGAFWGFKNQVICTFYTGIVQNNFHFTIFGAPPDPLNHAPARVDHDKRLQKIIANVNEYGGRNEIWCQDVKAKLH